MSFHQFNFILGKCSSKPFLYNYWRKNGSLVGLWIEMRSLQRNPLTRLEMKALKKSDLIELDKVNVFCSRYLNSIGNCFDRSPMFNLYTRLFEYVWKYFDDWNHFLIRTFFCAPYLILLRLVLTNTCYI